MTQPQLSHMQAEQIAHKGSHEVETAGVEKGRRSAFALQALHERLQTVSGCICMRILVIGFGGPA